MGGRKNRCWHGGPVCSRKRTPKAVLSHWRKMNCLAIHILAIRTIKSTPFFGVFFCGRAKESLLARRASLLAQADAEGGLEPLAKDELPCNSHPGYPHHKKHPIFRGVFLWAGERIVVGTEKPIIPLSLISFDTGAWHRLRSGLKAKQIP